MHAIYIEEHSPFKFVNIIQFNDIFKEDYDLHNDLN